MLAVDRTVFEIPFRPRHSGENYTEIPFKWLFSTTTSYFNVVYFRICFFPDIFGQDNRSYLTCKFLSPKTGWLFRFRVFFFNSTLTLACTMYHVRIYACIIDYELPEPIYDVLTYIVDRPRELRTDGWFNCVCMRAFRPDRMDNA